MTDTSIAEIYNSIVGGFFLTYKEEVKGLIEQIVPTSVYCFNELCKLLLPIPTKPHQLFNLRDISKVFQGICNVKDFVLPDARSFCRVWVHEMNRVFRDRLLAKEDLNKFDGLIRLVIETRISVDSGQVFDKERILYGDFMDKDADNRIYREIESLDKMQTVL